MLYNRLSLLNQLDSSLRAFTVALHTVMESIKKTQTQPTNKEALLRPALKADPKPSSIRSMANRSFWKKVGAPAVLGRSARSDLVRIKIDALRRSSSPTHPVCFRCGNHGHLAAQSRNAVLCFACNHLGHQSTQCKVILELPSTTTPSDPPPKTPHQEPPVPSTDRTMHPIHHFSDIHLKPAIRTFTSTPDSIQLEAAFKSSFILHDNEHWGPERIQAALYHLDPLYNWTVRTYAVLNM